MSDVQLERSVLEAKERDELFAIAVALGTSPAARTKKADLVSHILQVTGVEADAAPAADKPRRPRARKPAAGPQTGPVTEMAPRSWSWPRTTQQPTVTRPKPAPTSSTRSRRPAAPATATATATSAMAMAPATSRSRTGAAERAPPGRRQPARGQRRGASSGPTRAASRATTSTRAWATAGAGGGATGKRRPALPSGSSPPSAG